MIPWWAIALFVCFDLAFCAVLILGMINIYWTSIARKYPAQPPAHDAVSRRFQSFKFGICNFGGCVHVSVDDRFLHLTPVKWIQALGAKPMSVPWSAMQLVKQGTRWSKIKLERETIAGPAWCLNLASPEVHSESAAADNPTQHT